MIVQVEQRNIPGIDACFLAMDTEEGVEVVWNEVMIRNWDHKQSKVKEEKIKVALEQLIQLDHPNIVKMHKFWTDVKEDAVRVIFITEYMSSGSLKQFLKKTKRNVIKMALPVSSSFLCFIYHQVLNAGLEAMVHPASICTLLHALFFSSRDSW